MGLPFLKRQGNIVVKRTADGLARAAARVKPNEPMPETWRKALSKLTDGGKDVHLVLYNLAMGYTYEPVLPDGRKGTAITPSPEVRRACAMDIHRMLHGKEVAETEVTAAEEEAASRAQLEAMSDKELEAFIDADYRELETGAPETARGNPSDDELVPQP